MKVDYLENPLGVVKKFFIPYKNKDKQLYLEARIRAITEEGFDEAGWFEVEVGYPKKNSREFSELSKNILNYKQLSERSVPSLKESILKLANWCKQEGFTMFSNLEDCFA